MATLRRSRLFTFHLGCFLFPWLLGVHGADFQLKVCFTDLPEGSTQTNVTLTCPDDHVIRVEDALVGRSAWRICDLVEGDCTDPRTGIFQVCDGLQNCTVTVMTYSTRCRDTTTLMLGYFCDTVYVHSLAPPILTVSTTVSIEPTEATPTRRVPPAGGSTHWPVYHPEKKKEDEGEDIGVVIGCAIAAIITSIMLIIAIIIVARALLQYYKNGQDGAPQGRVVGCLDSVCLQVDRLPGFSSRDPDPDTQGGRKQQMSLANCSTSNPPAKVPNDRVAPVGQEGSRVGSLTSVDSGLSSEAHTSPNPSPQRPTETDQRVQSGNAHHRVPRVVSPSDVLLRNEKRASGNGSRGITGSPDKVSSWREKELPNRKMPPHIDQNLNVSGTVQTEHKPKFDAVGLPNTETVTSC